jgi:isocitrate dehydrogenase
MVIFRENTEDIYVGIEFEADRGEPQVQGALQAGLSEAVQQDPFPGTSGIGIKPVSQEGTERLVRAAIEYAIAEKRKSMTLVHRSNICQVHGRRLPELGLRARRTEFGASTYTWEQWERTKADKGEKAPTPSRTRRRAPARSSSRTRSPTSRCSRCSRGRTSSTSSRR